MFVNYYISKGTDMIRFAICDTDTVFLDKLATILHREFDPCSIEYMYGPSALEVSLKADPGGVDILLTEITLREENAIEIIKNWLKSSSPAQVIYMTSNIEYCTEVYESRHCGFLLKPLELPKLIRDVKRAIRLLEQRKQNGIMVQKGGGYHIINPLSLLYMESQGRVVRFVTNGEILETYGKSADFVFQLDKRFLQCHKSYLVNMERVARFCGDRFLMENDVMIPISQSRRKEAREQFLAYMGRVPSTKKSGF